VHTLSTPYSSKHISTLQRKQDLRRFTTMRLLLSRIPKVSTPMPNFIIREEMTNAEVGIALPSPTSALCRYASHGGWRNKVCADTLLATSTLCVRGR